jgi:transposase
MMSWTPEYRRRHAPAIEHVVRNNAITRLAATVDVINPPAWTGRPRLWSTPVMLQALWWLCRAGSAWKLLPGSCPPRQTIGSRLERWRRLEVLERALAST